MLDQGAKQQRSQTQLLRVGGGERVGGHEGRLEALGQTQLVGPPPVAHPPILPFAPCSPCRGTSGRTCTRQTGCAPCTQTPPAPGAARCSGTAEVWTPRPPHSAPRCRCAGRTRWPPPRRRWQTCQGSTMSRYEMNEGGNDLCVMLLLLSTLVPARLLFLTPHTPGPVQGTSWCSAAARAAGQG